MSAISFSEVTKTFGDTVAVENFSLEIADGEFLALLGPSGCGKSTALRMLAGLETPTSGTISIDGEIVNDIDARHRDVAMVFQSYALYPHMTVAKNIESPLIGRRSEQTTRDERALAVQRTAELLGLQDLLDRKPAQLSGGQRQRVALARAIVRRPAVFLMDEPLSNLDAKLRTATRAELVDLHRELGATFVYVTHDQVEAMTMATRIAVLVDGRLLQVADPRTLYNEPANVFVARFIGSPPMNIVPGAALPSLAATTDDGITFDIGIRPEHLRVAPAAEGIAATVVGREWLGHEQILDVEIAGGHRVLLRETAEHEHVDAAPGARVHLAVEPRHVHLFDAESGERVANGGRP